MYSKELGRIGQYALIAYSKELGRIGQYALNPYEIFFMTPIDSNYQRRTHMYP